ncbi:MAG TPA: hypothetical protein VGG64_28215 [Pirellulales bacterium]
MVNATKSHTDWKDLHRKILSAIDIRTECEKLGVKFTGSQPNDGGWLACHAIGREDESASAAVCITCNGQKPGCYTDLGGGDGKATSFWDLAARLNPSLGDWKDVRSHYAERCGIDLPGRRNIGMQRSSRQLAEHLIEWKPSVTLNNILPTWARAKNIDPCAAIRAGAAACRGCDSLCVGFKGFRPDDWSKPTAIVLYRYDGKEFAAHNDLAARKTHTVAGSVVSLIIVGTAAELACSTHVWKCEGLPDALALAPHLPAGHIAVTTTHGAKKFDPALNDAFRDKFVAIFGDADVPGQEGVVIAASQLVTAAKEVRCPVLPYEIQAKHGKDLRDWFSEGRTIAELLTIIKATLPFAQREILAPSLDEVDQTKAREKAIAQVRTFSNAVAVGSGEDEIVLPLTVQELLAALFNLTDNWPRRLGDALFVPKENGISWLMTPPALFGWVAEKTKSPVFWERRKGCVTKEELFATLQRVATNYTAIEHSPHVPPIEGHYYACAHPTPGDGTALGGLLDRFCPADDIDADLIKAMFATAVWGGPSGSRPAFVITADKGRGIGKTKLAEMLGSLVGGLIDFSTQDKIDAIKTRLLSDEGLSKRIATLDNVKSFKFSWAELEAIITAPAISGHRMYVGEGSRPNTLMWIITLNGASLSADMAQRSVIIKLKTPNRSGTWEEETVGYIRVNRLAIIADLVGFFDEPRSQLAKFSRWSAWEREVLSRLPEPADAQQRILERQAEADVEAEESTFVEDYFGDRLAELSYDIDKERIHIPSHIVCRWYNRAANENRSATAISRFLNQMCKEGKLKSISPNPCKTVSRGFLWTGWQYEEGTTVRNDLQSRHEAFERDKRR